MRSADASFAWASRVAVSVTVRLPARQASTRRAASSSSGISRSRASCRSRGASVGIYETIRRHVEVKVIRMTGIRGSQDHAKDILRDEAADQGVEELSMERIGGARCTPVTQHV